VGHKCHCFSVDFQLIEWEGGPLGEASQETCPDIYRFSIRGGRMEKENSWPVSMSRISTVFRPRSGAGWLQFEGDERQILNRIFYWKI
jgi:hypothetical protein